MSFLLGQANLSTADFLSDVFSSARGSSTAAIPKALDEIWNIAMRGNMYKLTCSFGLLIAVIGVGFWCLKFYKALQEGTLQPAVNEMVFPLIIVIMLSNGGNNMRNVTMTVRDMLNGVNRSANTAIDADVSIKTALSILTGSNAAIAKASTLISSCDNVVADDNYTSCLARQAAVANVIIRQITKDWPPNDPNSSTTNKNPFWRNAIRSREAALKRYPVTAAEESRRTRATSPSSAPSSSPSPNPSASPSPSSSPSPSPSSSSPSTTIPIVNSGSGELPVFSLARNADISGFEHIVSSFATSFLYIVEVLMLITGLVGPVFLGLSMFPVPTKPVIAWGVSFLSLGFCKICFTLISGLSAIAMVYAGFDQDMLVASIVLGLLAPVLSFGIASGSGLNALSSIGMISQNFGMNAGVAFGEFPVVPPIPTVPSDKPR
jgi:hypothetical protein